MLYKNRPCLLPWPLDASVWSRRLGLEPATHRSQSNTHRFLGRSENAHASDGLSNIFSLLKHSFSVLRGRGAGKVSVLTQYVYLCIPARSQDAWGNNETRDVADEEGSTFQVELSFGSRTLGPSTMGAPEYIGDGAYSVGYVATKVSRKRLSIREGVLQGTTLLRGRKEGWN